jgi:hypothetical protein
MASSVRIRPVVALVVLLALPMTASGRLSCLSACNPQKRNNDCCLVDPAFGEACAIYRSLIAADKVDVDDCVAFAPTCQPLVAGRCTVIRSCTKKCRRLNLNTAQNQKDAFGSFDCDGAPLTAGQRRAAARACNRCAKDTVSTTTTSTTTIPTTTVVTTTSTTDTGPTTTATPTTTMAAATKPPGTNAPRIGDRCFNACLNRLNAVHDCYSRCNDACNGDRDALPICQQSCRNAFCLALKARCTLNENNPEKTDPVYKDCCDAAGTCFDPADASCETTTTTTSSTTSTSTSSTSLTTTTTSPQP